MFVRTLAVGLLLLVAVALAARPSGGTGHERVYRVRPYDTLWSIAVSQYGGDPRDAITRIARRNHIRDALIRPGQRLLLPP
jgi:nucleoid-associated protein YgaU